MSRVAVIGAGVIGLSSALHVLDQCPSVQVTVFANSFPPNTTTNVSAGFWMPVLPGNTPDHLVRKWSGITLDYMYRLARSDMAKTTGASMVSGYSLSDEEVGELPTWADLVHDFKRVDEKDICNIPGMRSGFFFTSVVLEPGPYLVFLMNRIQSKGAIMIKRRVTSLQELAEEGYDVIVNCTGFGARDLVNDKGMQAVRGQVMRVNAPWIKHFYFMTREKEAHYLLPGMSYVVVGGTKTVGDENVDISISDRDQILKECTNYAPSLKEATIISDHVGLRPLRSVSVRLEQEIVQINDQSQVVIHNYGHGGSGVTFHWGCAQETASLVKHALRTKKSKSRL